MPKVDLDAVPVLTGSAYPPPFDRMAGGRRIRELSAGAGLTDFNVSHVALGEGDWSSQRHWHEGEDEFLVVVRGAATLIDDAGRMPLGLGDCVAFPKNDGNGHHLIGGPGGCTFVVWGRPEATDCHYSDIDLKFDAAAGRYVRKDGSTYGENASPPEQP